MGVVLLLACCAIAPLAALAIWLRMRRSRTLTVGFLHPYCNAGGGGERVLWCAIDSIVRRYSGKRMRIVVYTGDRHIRASQSLDDAQRRFNIDIDRAILATGEGPQLVFRPVRARPLVEARLYPAFTMLGQSLGSMLLGLEALCRDTPHVWMDTTGFAFTYPLAKLAGCRVATYTHYPTISTDMLSLVASRRPSYNNDATVAGSSARSRVKLIYYRLFAWAYGLAGRAADLVMVNSTWTHDHIVRLWGGAGRTHIVYPPCDTSDMLAAADRASQESRDRVAVSVGQFRPEKDHALQIRALRALHDASPRFKDVRLLLVGSCRGPDDEGRVDALRALARTLGLEHAVEFRVNAPYGEMRDAMVSSEVGLHTMWNEHFGICVVEMMACGLLTVAHNSGGPRADIIRDVGGTPAGFLASTPAEYADAMAMALDGCMRVPGGSAAVRRAARAQCERFSQATFQEQFMKWLDHCISGLGNC